MLAFLSLYRFILHGCLSIYLSIYLLHQVTSTRDDLFRDNIPPHAATLLRLFTAEKKLWRTDANDMGREWYAIVLGSQEWVRGGHWSEWIN